MGGGREGRAGGQGQEGPGVELCPALCRQPRPHCDHPQAWHPQPALPTPWLRPHPLISSSLTGAPESGRAPSTPIHQLGPRMPHAKAGVPGRGHGCHPRVPCPPHPMPPSSSCPILTPSHVGSLIWVPQPCQCRALPLQLKTCFPGCPRCSSTSGGTASSYKGPAVYSPGSGPSPVLTTRRSVGAGIWSTVLCGPVTEPRSLSLGPSRSPTHLIRVPASSPPQTPGCPGQVPWTSAALTSSPARCPSSWLRDAQKWLWSKTGSGSQGALTCC